MHIKINFMDVFNNSIGSKIIVSKLKGYTKMCTPSFGFFYNARKSGHCKVLTRIHGKLFTYYIRIY